MGRYLFEVKGSMLAPSPTCTGARVHPPYHRQSLRESSPRQGWARRGDVLAAAGPAEMTWQRGCGDNSLGRGSVRDERGCLRVKG